MKSNLLKINNVTEMEKNMVTLIKDEDMLAGGSTPACAIGVVGITVAVTGISTACTSRCINK
uniref:SmbA n=1 Tax=Streptococcus mutans TaxID=1309 RepID=Q5TLL1_STRMG|nr:SmbA precursor [Streptococcus mutans]